MSNDCTITAATVSAALNAVAKPDKRVDLERFFQVFPGGYGEGDRFLGVIVPEQRRIAKKVWRDIPIGEVEVLIASPVHEERLTGVLLAIAQFNATTRQRENGSVPPQADLFNLIVRNIDFLNNWDLIDTAAPKITGPWLLNHDRALLWNWSESGNLWRERHAVMATFAFIRAEEYEPTLELARRFLRHSHDLIHKAVGWMLREIGKRDGAVERSFLDEHAADMPRTMLRYAIERFPADERTRYRSMK